MLQVFTVCVERGEAPRGNHDVKPDRYYAKGAAGAFARTDDTCYPGWFLQKISV